MELWDNHVNLEQNGLHWEGIWEHLIISQDITVEEHGCGIDEKWTGRWTYTKQNRKFIKRSDKINYRFKFSASIRDRGTWREKVIRCFSTQAQAAPITSDFLKTMDYQPVIVRKYPRTSSKRSAESRYWRQFKNPVFVKEYAPVTSVHFSPTKPHRYAVTAATRVQIYAPRTQKITKTISRFKDVARSGCIRADGKLVVAGDDTGLVQVSSFQSYKFSDPKVHHRCLT